MVVLVEEMELDAAVADNEVAGCKRRWREEEQVGALVVEEHMFDRHRIVWGLEVYEEDAKDAGSLYVGGTGDVELHFDFDDDYLLLLHVVALLFFCRHLSLSPLLIQCPA
jgi:uncharacterized protein YdeI (YjbR/CyaY-like superfamily)